MEKAVYYRATASAVVVVDVPDDTDPIADDAPDGGQ